MALTLLQRVMRMLDRKNRGEPGVPTSESEIFDWEYDERRDLYTRWESLYANSIYLEQQDGGFREIILEEDIKVDTDKPLHGYYNPVGCVVDAYQNCFRGNFGDQIKVAETVGGVLQNKEEKPVNPEIIDPLGRIFRWSNLNESKESMQIWCANLGTVGLRIEAPTIINGVEIPPDRRKVRVRPIHPREIVDFDEENGNIKRVLIRYSRLEGGLGENRNDEPTVFEEELTTEFFRRKRDDKIEFTIENQLGVCPFVLLRHKDVGAQFGVPAHFGTEQILHLINWLLTRTSISVDRHVFAKWFAAAGGSKPESFDLGDTTVAYVQTSAGDASPKLEAIVAKLDFIGIEKLLQFFIAHLRQRQPELVLSALEAMSGQSGETIAKLLTPIEEKITLSRGHYEHALIRAMQIGLSWGIVNGIWTIGGGNAVADADRAYETGLLDFQFNDRSALPETTLDRIQRAKADVAHAFESGTAAAASEGITSQKEQLRIMGYSESQITKIMNEKAEDDVVSNANAEAQAQAGGSIPAA